MKFFSLLLAFSLVISQPVLADEDMSITGDTARFLQEFDTTDIWQDLKQTDDSLYGYLEQTYRANPTIFAARAQLMAVQEDLTQAQAGYLPQVTAEADVTYTNTETEGNSFITGDGDNIGKGAALSVQQPLYRGGQTTSNIDVANNAIAAEQFALSEIEQTVLLQAVTAYMNLYQNQAIVALRENNRNLVAKELDQAQARFDVGELTITDVSQSKARLAQAESRVIQAQADVKGTLANFKAITGVAPHHTKLSYPVLRFDAPNDLQGAIDLALTNNRGLIQARFNKQVATAQTRAIEGEIKPQLNAVSRLNKSFTPSDFIDEQRQLVVGLNASMPLYAGGAVKSRIRQAEKRVLQRDALIEALANQVTAEVTANWEQWKAAQATNIALEAQIKAARVAQEGVQYEMEYGERTTLDALNANQEFLTAQTDLISSQTNEVIAFFTLAESLGLLVPANLGFDGVAVR